MSAVIIGLAGVTAAAFLVQLFCFYTYREASQRDGGEPADGRREWQAL